MRHQDSVSVGQNVKLLSFHNQSNRPCNSLFELAFSSKNKPIYFLQAIDQKRNKWFIDYNSDWYTIMIAKKAACRTPQGIGADPAPAFLSLPQSPAHVNCILFHAVRGGERDLGAEGVKRPGCKAVGSPSRNQKSILGSWTFIVCVELFVENYIFSNFVKSD